MSADTRTVEFRRLLRGLAHACGLDPDRLHRVEAEALASHLTEAAEEAWRSYDWPDTVRTEGRLLLPEFALGRVNVLGDIVWDVETAAYYEALQDGFAGIAVEDEAYWEKRDETFARTLPWSSEGDNPLAELLGAYDRDPALDNDERQARRLSYTLTNEGMAFEGGAPNTVYVRFRLPPPRFTAVAWASGTSYAPGALAYVDPECYLALQANSGTPQGPASAPERWRAQRVPEVIRQAVKLAAKAAWLSGEGEDERALALAGVAEEKVLKASETLAKDQGQRRRYGVVTRGSVGRAFRPRAGA